MAVFLLITSQYYIPTNIIVVSYKYYFIIQYLTEQNIFNEISTC